MALLLRLLLVLTPICGGLPRDPELNPPITNLRLDLGNKRLTWDLSGNVSKIACYVNGAVKKVKNNRYCQLYVLPKCGASNYTVQVTVPSGKLFSTWIEYPRQALGRSPGSRIRNMPLNGLGVSWFCCLLLFFATPEGNPRAAAEHLGCRVHDLHVLTCSWAVGAEAPRDVQYDLYMEDIGTGKKWSCPRYPEKEPGARVQCQFADVSQLPNEEDHLFRVVVQGASGGARVPCAEIFKSLLEIEELTAPNLTASCNKSLAVLQWTMLSHFAKTFEYELDIRKDSGVPLVQSQNLSTKSWILPNPGTFTVSIRAHGGRWSARQRFVCGREDQARLSIWLIALAMLLAAGAAILLCKKYSVLQKLFPPIPRMKDPIGDKHGQEKMMDWQTGPPAPEDCPVAEVQLVKDT